MARLSEHGLRKSVGVSGMFATAYGNVGSSIYYALGLVAAHALGLTPVVFIFAGGLFALTAKTYAEGASMLPEAGGPPCSPGPPLNVSGPSFPAGGSTLASTPPSPIRAFSCPTI